MPDIEGVILAGGRATRMQGRDKGLVMLKGSPLYQQVLQRLSPQVSRVIISANRNLDTYRQSGCIVIKDSMENYPGPLAGILSAMEHTNAAWILSVPCDVPFIPTDLASVLWQGKGNAHLAYIDDGTRYHPTLALWHCDLLPRLRTFLQQGERKLMHFMHQMQAQAVIYPKPECFFNINSLKEYQQAQQQEQA